jgi:nuclear GTP-binding protein
MVKKSHGSSKRIGMKDRYKIQRKVKEHHRKARRAAKRSLKSGSSSLRKKSDPGIPNLFPFKKQLLRQMEEQKQRMDERKLVAEAQRRQDRADRKAGKVVANDLDVLMQNAEAATGTYEQNSEADAQSQANQDALTNRATLAAATSNSRTYYRELNKVLDASDILLEVLDVRDPMGCRSASIESKFLGTAREKRVVIVLTKIDLVPPEVTMQWLRYFRREHPCVAFKSSAQKSGQGQSQKLGHATGGLKHAADKLDSALCIGGDTLLQLLKNYSRTHNMKKAITVGVVGYPNVGKSSLINSLKRTRAVGVSATPGYTKVLQEVQLDSKVKLIDSPGVIFEDSDATNDQDKGSSSLLLRNCVSPDTMVDPVPAATAICARCKVEQLMELYSVPQYRSADEFLWHLAKLQGKLLKGGVPDRDRAARLLVRDWNVGKIPFYTLPPVTAQKSDATILSSFTNNEGFDIDEAFAANESAVVEGRPAALPDMDDYVFLGNGKDGEGEGDVSMGGTSSSSSSSSSW